MYAVADHPSLRILGPIEIEGAERVPRGRPLALLALLLVGRGDLVPLDRVVDELWAAAEPRHARKAAHVVASRLRRALGGGALRFESGGYRLGVAPEALDAGRFEALQRDGTAALARGEPGEAAAILRRALALWRGPALADVAGERFAQPEIARLEELRFACLSARIDADLGCGRHAALVGELEALVHAHPLREGLRAQQMLALYGAGRPADALAAYRDAYAALAGGLGVAPSPRLRALEAAILRHEVGGAEAEVKPHARKLAPCDGRGSERTWPPIPVGFRPPVLR
jgi:DNA-binding SARP family transcriptional activator